MALRIASLLGAGCLTQHVLGQEEKEYFPLSGGIDNGVEVEIQVDSIAADSSSKIEFVDRERKAAFRFVIDRANKQIIRESASEFGNAPPETFGGFPSALDAASSTSIVFTKRRHEIAVSIGGQRFPWFDYQNKLRDASAPLLTHVAVFSGLANPEVTLRRPACSKACHPNECLDSSGKSVCQATNTSCFSVTMSDTLGVASSCSSAQETTPGGNQHCCDGDDAPPPARYPLAKGGYLRLDSSETYLKRICESFGIDPCIDQHAGRHVEILNDPGVSKTGLDVFVPFALDDTTRRDDDHALPAHAKFTLPSFAMYQIFSTKKVIVELKETWDDQDKFQIDPFWDVVTKNDYAPFQEAGLAKGWTVGIVTYNFRYDRAARYTRRIDSFFANSPNKTLYLSDQPVTDELTCTDLEMLDDYEKSCADYDETICTKQGYSTPEGCTSWGDKPAGCLMPGGTDVASGLKLGDGAAAMLCCACGGGKYELPESWGNDAVKVVLK